MGDPGSDAIQAFLEAYDLSGLTTVVDVGGGEGALVQAILERYPLAQGVLFDLLPVVVEARALRGSTAGARCSFIGGTWPARSRPEVMPTF